MEKRISMSVQKKQIILNEIAFWKQNKLLPEHYCDFLTALYAQGEKEEIEVNNQAVLEKEKKKASLKMNGVIFLIGLITLAILTALLTMTSNILPIIFAGVAVILFVYIAIKLAKNNSILTPLLFVFSALLLLGVTFKIWEAYFISEPNILLFMIIANCILWLLSGVFLKLIYFTISGIVGIIFILVYIAYIYIV